MSRRSFEALAFRLPRKWRNKHKMTCLRIQFTSLLPSTNSFRHQLDGEKIYNLMQFNGLRPKNSLSTECRTVERHDMQWPRLTRLVTVQTYLAKAFFISGCILSTCWRTYLSTVAAKWMPDPRYKPNVTNILFMYASSDYSNDDSNIHTSDDGCLHTHYTLPHIRDDQRARVYTHKTRRQLPNRHVSGKWVCGRENEKERRASSIRKCQSRTANCSTSAHLLFIVVKIIISLN